MPNGRELDLQISGQSGPDIQMTVNAGGEAPAANAEAWAVGQRHGVDVSSNDDTYHNNAKYYAEQAAAGGQYSSDSEAWAKGTRGGTAVESTDPAYHNNSKYYSEQAAGSATDANTAKTDAVTAKNAAVSAKNAAETALTHQPKIESGTWWIWNATNSAYVNTNVKATGDAWHVVKTYASVSAMEADYSGTDTDIGDFVMIVSTVEDPDNAKVYVKGASAWSFVVDMSGATGIQGQAAYVHIRYAAAEPTQDSDMKTTPDAWIGIYSGTSSTAPTAYTSYTWFNFKGATGATPQLSIGTVETVAASSGAAASLTGTTDNPVLNLQIPRGVTGNESIDDTKGIGDTDYVWSADKVAKELNEKAPVILETIDTPAAIVSFSDGADDLPMALTVGIEPVQSGTGDPSPTNIRPISGWTGANVTRTGKNLFDKTRDIYKSGYILADDGTDSTSANYNIYQNSMPAGNYEISIFDNVTSSGKAFKVITYKANGQVIQLYSLVVNGRTEARIPFVVTDDTAYIRYCLRISSQDESIKQKDVYPITFPSSAGTVYGGTLTINKDGSGTLVVDRKNVDLGSISWSKYMNGANWLFQSELSDNVREAAQDTPSHLTSSIYKTYNANTRSNLAANMTDKSIAQSTGGTAIYVKDYDYSDAAAFKTAMAEVQMVYELATPLAPITLTAPQVKTLLGVNNIWADTGDVISCTYAADTKLYIDNLTKPTEDDMTANNNIPSGQFFMVGNHLFLSTQAIAQGADIIPGTNCTAYSLAEALNTINQ